MTTIPKEAIQDIANAIEDAQVGYSITLTSLIDGVSTFTLQYDDGSDPLEFNESDAAYEHVRERRRLTQAEAALSAALPHLSKTVDAERHERGIPEGWQLVPKEPTNEMNEAGQAEAEEDERVFGSASPHHIYVAMLSAAPQPAGTVAQAPVERELTPLGKAVAKRVDHELRHLRAFVEKSGDAASPPPAVAEEVGVKALEWRPDNMARSLGLIYFVSAYTDPLNDGRGKWISALSGGGYSGRHHSIEDAKAAAQADYENRIRSTLSSTATEGK